MSGNTAAANGMVSAGVSGNCLSRAMKATASNSVQFIGGLLALGIIWWLAIYWITQNPSLSQFEDFSPKSTFAAFPQIWEDGTIQAALTSSGFRLGWGLGLAIAIGVPIGIVFGRVKWFQNLFNVPFQFLRMISPLSWEPIAVVVFAGWEEAIIFLIAVAAVWPVVFSTAAGLAKVDPNWFKVARNLGAKPYHMVTRIIIPAILFDVLTGIRLALGVAWIVIIPAEFLGVSSGFGYAIQDARESLEYSQLMAYILVIGAVGYVLDTICVLLIKRYSWHRG
ncbi:ABC transporter permease [Betaproteobacteria bacterium SCN1]|nr:ABC transporter permease [Betaproteobacteria bacterium SCN1]MBN8760744.1 ABC transporter permease [Thiobacillus sp.]ODU90746.1 MAG: nitrate ABC transporter permease [Thiobacillus sp. SCN 65-179]OJW35828.1 MAG: nitrate ABC transporter permease [Thiobacillus sp. 65-69]